MSFWEQVKNCLLSAVSAARRSSIATVAGRSLVSERPELKLLIFVCLRIVPAELIASSNVGDWDANFNRNDSILSNTIRVLSVLVELAIMRPQDTLLL